VRAAPDDAELRVLLAERLLAEGRLGEAMVECGALLAQDPEHAAARALMARALAPPAPAAGADGFDWRAAEQDLGDLVPPAAFVDGAAAPPPADAWEAAASGLTLQDVAGMAHVKDRLRAAFLAPMRNPELRRLYGKSLRGGLLLYGPPGCGKTFLARAVAGELGAKFISVGLSDILDMWVGSSERNVHELFEQARREAPCVVFLDELDSLGQKRSQTRMSATRGAVTQLLAELDGVDGRNEGVFVLAATNHPWDVDAALRRPGRLDQTLLVLPPDAPARAAVFRFHLRDRPVAGVDPDALAARTEGLSGADIAHVCELAAERALLDSVRTGRPRLIGPADLEAAADQVRPSMGAWFETARNVVLFGDGDGSYDDLRAYLKKLRRL
jgi:SpoVK/Ycf46/Vps4 family AAA+-type ATPase